MLTIEERQELSLAGRAAYGQGWLFTDNPFTEGSEEATWWHDGWMAEEYAAVQLRQEQDEAGRQK